MSLNTLEQAQDFIAEFCKKRNWGQFHGPKDLAIGAVTEAAELVEIFRFLSDDEIKEKMKSAEFREGISDELADVLFFLLRFCEMNDFNLLECLEKKMQKNDEKYPVGKAQNNNQKYTKLIDSTDR